LVKKIVSLYPIFFSKIVYLYRFKQYIFEYRCPTLLPGSKTGEDGMPTRERWVVGGGATLSGCSMPCWGWEAGEDEQQVAPMGEEDVARTREEREDEGLTGDREATTTATATRSIG
jgi:hypothetical protein